MHKNLPDNLPGIRRAPGPRFTHDAARLFEDEKLRLQNRLPVLSTEEIIRHRSPFIMLFQQLLSMGYQHVVDEILELKELEQLEVENCRRPRAVLLRDMKLLTKVTGVLKICRRLEVHQKHLKAARGRYRLAEELLEDGDTWLGRHFVSSALSRAEKEKSEESYEFQSKMHCLLAHLAKDYYTVLEDRIAHTVDHLETALMLSKNQPWLNRTKYISIPLRTPMAIYGIREETKEVWSANYTVYKQSMLIYYDLLMMLSDPKFPLHRSSGEVSVTYKLAEEALHMAKETRNSTAVIAALLRCGILMRRIGRYLTAKNYFDQMLYEAEFAQDYESQALAYANIAHCYQAQMQPEEALNWFHLENELSREFKFLELQADSFENIGYILLQEGVLTEAELALRDSYVLYKRSLPQEKTEEFFRRSVPEKEKSYTDSTWAFTAVAAGTNLWGRLAGLCRQGHQNEDALDSVLDWKDRRENPMYVPAPNRQLLYSDDVVDGLDEQGIPYVEHCDLECIKSKASYMLKIAAVDQSGIALPQKPRVPRKRDWRQSMPGDNIQDSKPMSEKTLHIRYLSDGPAGEEEVPSGRSRRSTKASWGDGILSPRTSRASRILSFARGASGNQDLVIEDGRVLGYVPSRSHSMLRNSQTEVGEVRASLFDIRPSEESAELRDFKDEPATAAVPDVIEPASEAISDTQAQ